MRNITLTGLRSEVARCGLGVHLTVVAPGHWRLTDETGDSAPLDYYPRAARGPLYFVAGMPRPHRFNGRASDLVALACFPPNWKRLATVVRRRRINNVRKQRQEQDRTALASQSAAGICHCIGGAVETTTWTFKPKPWWQRFRDWLHNRL